MSGEIAFHANDIRGIYPDEIDEKLSYNVGFAFAKKIKAKKMFIGKDIRRSSKPLARACIEGIRDAGCTAIDLGLVDTPGLYYATGKWNLPGIMITASHNPPKYNGIICSLSKARTIGGIDLKNLIPIFSTAKAKKKGSYKKKSIKKEYEKYLLSQFQLKSFKPLKIVIDTGSGMAGLFVKDIFSKLPAKVTPLYWKLDGRFPHHLPNSADPKNLASLQKEVLNNKADLGILFDGDADRAAFVDEKGEIVRASFTAALFSEHILKRKKGNVLYNVIASKIVPETIVRNLGKPIIEKIGHTHMKERMRVEKAIFGAEEYGHYYFKSNWYADSGLIAALLMYQIISKSKLPLSKIIEKYKIYFKSEDLAIETANKVRVVSELEEWCNSRKPSKIEKYDGKTFIYDKYWINIRASNTENFVRITIESNTLETKKEIESDLQTFIKSLPL